MACLRPRPRPSPCIIGRYYHLPLPPLDQVPQALLVLHSQGLTASRRSANPAVNPESNRRTRFSASKFRAHPNEYSVHYPLSFTFACCNTPLSEPYFIYSSFCRDCPAVYTCTNRYFMLIIFNDSKEVTISPCRVRRRNLPHIDTPSILLDCSRPIGESET